MTTNRKGRKRQGKSRGQQAATNPSVAESSNIPSPNTPESSSPGKARKQRQGTQLRLPLDFTPGVDRSPPFLHSDIEIVEALPKPERKKGRGRKEPPMTVTQMQTEIPPPPQRAGVKHRVVPKDSKKPEGNSMAKGIVIGLGASGLGYGAIKAGQALMRRRKRRRDAGQKRGRRG